MLKRRIVKKRCLYDFTLRLLHQYYRDMYNESLYEAQFDEEFLPSLFNIEKV